MSLPLHLRRKGIDKDEDHALEVPLSVLDYLLCTLFQRCATFEYSGFTADGRFRRFMLAILSSPAPMLRSFHLSHGEEEILLPPSVPILDVGTNWPMLREFVLDSVCMPLHRLRLTNLEILKIYVPICDTSPCQLYPGLGRCIANFVRASPTLRELRIKYEDGNENGDFAADPLDPVHIDDLCHASIQHLYLSGLWIAWLVPLRMLDSPPRLTNLSSLFISGNVTCPCDNNPEDQRPGRASKSVESLKVAVGGSMVGYIPRPASALELGPLLRNGDWTSLKELTLEGHGWLSEDALDVIIDALSDRNIAPCLQRLYVTRCSILGGLQYHPEPSDPSCAPRRDVDAAAYLAEMRSDGSELLSEPADTTRLSVKFSECKYCDWSGSESNSDGDLSP
ncbi:hypothetical protein EXIGLDRAFT_752185 [Exidia glandulosa HHB12029]|uniref:F-box domain-containing protein n=1 Tax=Exidia glandulosa HHB12029 TaxID=1314781 RepID=A0A165EQV7_EXIGL|nr:hypothetical protein EXIGLDRAFT_752185 [Exidia glandulosa HHB12029]